MVLVLKENNGNIRRKILEAGIKFPLHEEYKDALWLYFYPNDDVVFAAGYQFDETDLTPEEDIAAFAKDHPDAYYCKDVDEFITKINWYKSTYKQHTNRWPWGTTETVIIENGDAMVDMMFEDDNVGVCYISGLSVVPYRRREGLATKLMEYCEEFCRKREIFRLDLNSVKEQFVMDFYHKLGFCDIREENGYMKMYKIIKY